MDKKQGKMVIHSCGGCGINIAKDVIANLSQLGSGFAAIDQYYIDTSRNNIAGVDMSKFHLVTSESLSKASIDGSGAERKTHVTDISANLKVYLDKYNIINKEVGVYNVVIFGGAGGSGSVIAPLLIKNLLERDIPTIAVMVGDSTNGLSGINTLNTLATLHNIAIKASKPLAIMYSNNETFISNKGASEGIKEANKAIFNSLAPLSVFLSGMNDSLDNQDLVNAIDQSNYSTITIKPGLYALSVFAKDVVLPEGSVPTVARTLTVNGISPDINLQLLHHKTGEIVDENVINIYGDNLPIHLVLYTNYFNLEQERLKKYTDGIYNAMHEVKVETVTGSSLSEENDDGLVL